jgi:hypothetical protein
MKLTELGLDSGLENHASQLCGSGQRLARVTAVDRGRYVVRDEQGEVPAELTGKFFLRRGILRGYALRGRLGVCAVSRCGYVCEHP